MKDVVMIGVFLKIMFRLKNIRYINNKYKEYLKYTFKGDVYYAK